MNRVLMWVMVLLPFGIGGVTFCLMMKGPVPEDKSVDVQVEGEVKQLRLSAFDAVTQQHGAPTRVEVHEGELWYVADDGTTQRIQWRQRKDGTWLWFWAGSVE